MAMIAVETAVLILRPLVGDLLLTCQGMSEPVHHLSASGLDQLECLGG